MDSSVVGTDAPGGDEVEVSIFGPGVGECIVAHGGNGKWVVVDSCLDARAEPVALTYLEAMGFDPAEAIELVVVSHWHDDHTKGISQLFRRAKSATLAMSIVFDSEQVLELLRLARQQDPNDPSGEFLDLMNEISVREQAHGVPRYAIGNRLVHSSESVVVRALSPSDGTYKRSQVALAERLERAVTSGRRLVSQTPNEVAVVLEMLMGRRHILLGSDLETSSDSSGGWRAVLSELSVRGHGYERAELFKVPHHGSANAHSDEVWERHLVHQPHAALTPYRRSSLPKPEDCARLARLSPNVFLSAPVSAGRTPRRANTVEGQLRMVTRERRVLRGTPGHVRFRMARSGGPIRVELFHGAHRLAESDLG